MNKCITANDVTTAGTTGPGAECRNAVQRSATATRSGFQFTGLRYAGLPYAGFWRAAHRHRVRFHHVPLLLMHCLVAMLVATTLIATALVAQTTTKTTPIVVHQFQRDSWRVSDGLPRQEVTSIQQSPDGYLWFSAGQRIYRFDGVRFMPGLGPDSLFSKGQRPELRTPILQHVDAQRKLWVSYEGGKLARYVDGKFQTVMPYDSTMLYGPMMAAPTPSGGMIAIFRDQVYEWTNGKYQPVLSNGAPIKRASNLATDSAGVRYVGFRDGRVMRSDGHNDVWLTLPSRAPAPVSRMIAARNGALWIQQFDGILLWQNGSARGITPEDPTVEYTVMIGDGANGVWVGAGERGIWHYDATGSVLARITPAELDDASVNALHLDVEGSLWVGTTLGLERFRKVAFTTYAMEGGITEHNLLGVVWADSETFWTFGSDGHLQHVQLHPPREPVRDGQPLFASATITRGAQYGRTATSITPSNDGSLWINGAQQIDQWSPTSGKSTSFVGGDSVGTVMQIVEAKNGDVWAVTSRGPYKRVGQKFQKYIAKNHERVPLPPYFGFGMMYEGNDGDIWIGSGMLFEIEDDSVLVYSVKNGLSGQPVQAIHQDRTGTVWAAAGMGAITRVRDHKAVAISLGPNYAESFVTGLAEDTLGNLWLSGDIGVMRIPIAQLNAVADGRATSIDPMTFTVSDGLPNPSTIGIRSAYAAENGKLWFTFARGVAMVDPEKLYRNSLAPAVRVEDVVADDHVYSPDSVRQGLPAHTYRVEFHFTGTSLLVPSRMRFRYTLEGADNGWTEVGGLVRSATYTRLAPGPYTFRVQAANNDGVWNTIGTSLAFSVLPAWYQTWWANTGAVLLIIAMGAIAAWTVARVRLKQDEARMHAMMEERTRIAREVHDTLLQGFTGITLQLQGLKGKIRRAPEATEAGVGILLETADATLLAARQAVWEMRPPDLERATLAEALGVALRRTAGDHLVLRYRVAGTPRQLPPETEAAILRIGVEAASNAVKHARASTLDVDLTFARNNVQLCVRDDGCGFEFDPALAMAGSHFGLVGIRERAKKVGATVNISSTVGQGTTVLMLTAERSSRWPGRRR